MSQFMPHWRGQAAEYYKVRIEKVATMPKPIPLPPDNSQAANDSDAAAGPSQEPEIEIEIEIPPTWARVNFDKIAGALGDKGPKGAGRRLKAFKDVIEEHWGKFVTLVFTASLTSFSKGTRIPRS